MHQQYEILIAGAGIGGLTAASLLAQAGHRVTVFEQAPQLGEVGAGIQVSANGVKVLQSIGLGERLEAIGVKPKTYRFRLYNTGEILHEFDLAAAHEQRNGAPYYQVHRADIHAALVDRFEQLAPGQVRLNSTVNGYSEDNQGVTLHLADGRQVRGDLLIGADGIKSAVRRRLLGDTPAEFTGQSAWRIMVPTDNLPAGYLERVMTVWVGPGKHAVMYYVRGGELINFVGCVDNPDWTDESWTARAPWAELQRDFGGEWHPEIKRYIEAADHNACFRWALYNRSPVDNWSSRRATLLGDACHATLPYMAQGAVMAIEDGAVLARSLDQASEVSDALQLYQRNRIDRTARIVNESSDNARLFHLPSEQALREAFAARDFGGERNAWLYSYDPLRVELS